MSQRPAYLYLEDNFLKQENNELKELNECMLYKMLVFFKMSQNCKNDLLQNISENLACFAIKVSKTFKYGCYKSCYKIWFNKSKP